MAKKLTKSKAKEILHDKSVHGHPLTDKQRRFFGAIAGGEKPYKAQIGTLITGFHPNLKETASEVLSAPQKAVTQLITGKYQTPSEAMGIENAAGAFLTDVVLDPLGLMGLGAGAKAAKASTKTGILSKAYLKNPIARKELRDPNKSFRVAGMDAYDDFVESGILRSKTPEMPEGLSLVERMTWGRPTAFPSFQKGYADMRYLPEEGGVVFETSLPTFKRGDINPVTGNPVKGRHYAHRVIDTETGKVLSNVPGKDIKVYKGKPHWLMGYQEIKPPKKKQDGGWLDKFDAPQAQNGIEGTMGGLTDKGFNYNGAWGGAWRDGGSLLKAQTGDEFTPYSRNYLNNLRNEWVATYNKPIPYNIPRDDRFDEFYHEKVNTIPQYYKTIPAWVRGLGTDMEEYREGDKNTPPKSMGKLAKGYEWVENYRAGPFRDDSQIREYTRLIRSIRNAESRKPVWNRDVKFNFKSGGILQPPMAGADQTVPMAQLGDSVKPIPMQLAMGGSLPGAVGFTYARTQSPAPANGPYAKKTKASAQNGQEMKYYQAGLDFKPKTISQDGSEIPVDSMGYWNPDNWGNPVIIPSTDITMEGVDQPLIGISDTGDVQYMEPGEDYEFDGEYVTEYPVAQKGTEVSSSKKSSSAKPAQKETIYVDDPADPRLHSYLDSLNLNKAYLAQLRINPSKNIREALTRETGQFIDPVRLEKYIKQAEGFKKQFKSSSKSKQKKFFKPGTESVKDAWTTEKEFKKHVPQDAPLVDVYKSLHFSSPTQTGLWTTPDLYNENIAPIDVYYGGNKHTAWNPVFMAPVQPVEYRGKPEDYMEYRSVPTIFGSKYKFNPKSKLSPVSDKQKLTTTSTPTAESKKPEEPKKTTETKSVAQSPDPVATMMSRGKKVELLVDDFGNYEWFNTDDDAGDLKPIRRATSEEIARSKKQRNGGVNNADAQPLKKLDQLLNFTNYNKPTKGGWLDKYN